MNEAIENEAYAHAEADAEHRRRQTGEVEPIDQLFEAAACRHEQPVVGAPRATAVPSLGTTRPSPETLRKGTAGAKDGPIDHPGDRDPDDPGGKSDRDGGRAVRGPGRSKAEEKQVVRDDHRESSDVERDDPSRRIQSQEGRETRRDGEGRGAQQQANDQQIRPEVGAGHGYGCGYVSFGEPYAR